MEPDVETIHILFIDDDKDDYLILRDYLKDLDDPDRYVFDWASTYQAGLTQIQQADHDVYLIDYYLGANTGLELLQEALQAGCQAPIIMITGQSDRSIDQAALLAGATDYLVKNRLDGQLLERSIRYALERNRLLIKIRELAVRDALTGLYNRRELHRFLDYELIKCRRYCHPFSLLLMDIDHFKEINDRFGHRVGDQILQLVAQSLLANTRGCDLAARYGGDEFIIVQPETSGSSACIGAERIRKILGTLSSQVVNEHGTTEKILISASFGVAEYPGDAGSIESLIDKADQALYQAKRLGCDCVVRLHVDQPGQQGA